jgi:hypothetical protein
MGNLPTDQSPTVDKGYIPLQVFREYMEQETRSPYRTRFSIAKLIAAWRAQNNALPDPVLAPTIAHLEALEAQLQKTTQSWEALRQQDEVQLLLSHVFPSFFFSGQMGFIKGAFKNHMFLFQSAAMLDLVTSDRWEVKVDPDKFLDTNRQNILTAGTSILNTFYEQQVDIYSGEGMILRDRDTRIERHFQFNIRLDYLEVKALKPLKKLSRQQIQQLLNNLEDEELWLECFPPDHFVFEGFVIGVLADVTQPEILSTLKEMAANEGGKSDHEEDLQKLESLVRSYLNLPDLRFGVLQTVHSPLIETLTWCLLRQYDTPLMRRALEDRQSVYGQVMHSGQPVIVEDLQQHPGSSELERALLGTGLRSLLLVPLKDAEGHIISIFELGSPAPYRFSQLTLIQLKEFVAQIEIGANIFMQEMDHAINLTIQEEFTSIHPSVEWKFRQVASKYFWERVIQQKQSVPDPIVFKDIYPLYGQADIVGSSQLRNESIRADLTDNLTRLHDLLIACRQAVPFHLLDIYAERVQALLDRLARGGMVSSDESVIVELLTEQIHPLLRKLSDRFTQLPQEQLAAYFEYLDPDLDIVYRARKDYEDSVTLLNRAISHFLLEEEEKMQAILPHYFEKFQTDGVEYNIYLGQSLLETGEFHPFYLRDFRLWQLILMCEITRLVTEQSKTFPVPLTTAQLIFVYNNSLSIHFEMDEKQFDVDGAYNVRYEILKKRIDKAYVKGTDERLTQAGKVAIVWLQEEDRQEYQEYLDHLIRKGYIRPEIEDLELEKMQGVEGLRAMRVAVV